MEGVELCSGIEAKVPGGEIRDCKYDDGFAKPEKEDGLCKCRG